MKPLKHFLEGIPSSWNGKGNLTSPIAGVQSDSRKVKKGDLFVAVPGLHVDGHEFIKDALARGARAIVTERWNHQVNEAGISQFCVSSARSVLSQLTACAYDYPAQKIKVIGVTGTNGKTTITFLIRHLINSVNKCGLIGSIYYDDGKKQITSTHTTPSPEALQETLSKMVENGLSYCVMEVSSHALDQDRAEGIEFESAIFTNLTQDHLDYHHDFESYFKAKRKLFFSSANPICSIVNRDDLYGKRLLDELKKASSEFVSYGIKNPSDYAAKNIRLSLNGSEFELEAKGGKYHVSIPLILQHNLYNVLAAVASLAEMGFNIPDLIQHLSDFPGVSGRMERIDEGQDFHVFVDYAHTPDGLIQVLSSLEGLSKGRIISVFGCGGDRDPGKRSLMGEAASRYSDAVVITTDNSRSERPEDILAQIKTGIVPSKKVQTLVVVDRKEAIGQAIEMAETQDTILIFGKGHENYQIIGDQKIPFQDQDVARFWLKKKCSHLAKSHK